MGGLRWSHVGESHVGEPGQCILRMSPAAEILQVSVETLFVGLVGALPRDVIAQITNFVDVPASWIFENESTKKYRIALSTRVEELDLFRSGLGVRSLRIV